MFLKKFKNFIFRIFCKNSKKYTYLCSPDFHGSHIGEMLEWLKRHAWKACIRQKRIPSSNLGLSAKKDSLTGCLFSCRDLLSMLPPSSRYSPYTKPAQNVHAQYQKVLTVHKTQPKRVCSVPLR